MQKEKRCIKCNTVFTTPGIRCTECRNAAVPLWRTDPFRRKLMTEAGQSNKEPNNEAK